MTLNCPECGSGDGASHAVWCRYVRAEIPAAQRFMWLFIAFCAIVAWVEFMRWALS